MVNLVFVALITLLSLMGFIFSAHKFISHGDSDESHLFVMFVLMLLFLMFGNETLLQIRAL